MSVVTPCSSPHVPSRGNSKCPLDSYSYFCPFLYYLCTSPLPPLEHILGKSMGFLNILSCCVPITLNGDRHVYCHMCEVFYMTLFNLLNPWVGHHFYPHIARDSFKLNLIKVLPCELVEPQWELGAAWIYRL